MVSCIEFEGFEDLSVLVVFGGFFVFGLGWGLLELEFSGPLP